MKIGKAIVVGLAVCLAMVGVAFAAVTFDPETGVGFVGKGDVQLAFDWNNKALQDNVDNVMFRALSESVTEESWTCTNSNNENIQVRNRTTTTAIAGLVSAVARVRNQVTGFNLTGYDGTPTVEVGEPEGPQLNSCPSGPWTLTTPAGDPEMVGDSGTLVEVSSDDGDTWVTLQ